MLAVKDFIACARVDVCKKIWQPETEPKRFNSNDYNLQLQFYIYEAATRIRVFDYSDFLKIYIN